MPLAQARKMAKKTRVRTSDTVRAEVALAAIRRPDLVPDLAQRHGVTPNRVREWKRQWLDHAAGAFERDCAWACDANGQPSDAGD